MKKLFLGVCSLIGSFFILHSANAGCADLTKINGFNLTLSPFGATASGTVPEPSGLALIGLGSLFFLRRKKN